MLGLFCDKTYGAMTNYDRGDDNRDNDGNEDGNDKNNAASGSESYGPIFDLIRTPQYHVGESSDNGDNAAAVAHYVSKYHNIYLTYKDNIKDVS